MQRLVSVSSEISDASSLLQSLFSLQFYVHDVTFNSKLLLSSLVNPLLVAFQLLQYEIIVFDVPLAWNNDTKDSVVMSFQEGRSCLFKADPAELVHELQEDIPLTLLLVTKEHGKAKLRAFSAVTLSLHVGLLDANVKKLHSVCEWASQNGPWDLRDHHNAIVGSVNGVVTLSCLGKTLAPHLTQALGVQVQKMQPLGSMEVKVQVKPSDIAVEEKEMKKSDAPTTLQAQQRIKVRHSSVQCDEDIIFADATKSLPASKSQFMKNCNDSQVIDNAIKTVDAAVAGQLLYDNSSDRLATSHKPHEYSSRVDWTQGIDIKSYVLFPQELPPPLFFHKEAKRTKS